MGGFESEYEVDSPMQTLMLASLNGSPESQNGVEDDALSAVSIRDEDDIEMVVSGSHEYLESYQVTGPFISLKRAS